MKTIGYCFDALSMKNLCEVVFKTTADSLGEKAFKWCMHNRHNIQKIRKCDIQKGLEERQYNTILSYTSMNGIKYYTFIKYEYKYDTFNFIHIGVQEWRGKKYYFCIPVKNNIKFLFSEHFIERYFERQLGEKVTDITIEKLAKIVYDITVFSKDKYIHPETSNESFILKGKYGFCFGIVIEGKEEYLLFNTFVNDERAFEGQKVQLEELYKQYTSYAQSVDRLYIGKNINKKLFNF